MNRSATITITITIGACGDVSASVTEVPARESRGEKAVAFLEDAFRMHSTWASAAMYSRAREAGISRNALFEARTKLPIQAKKVTSDEGQDFWVWIAGEGWPTP